MGIIFSRKGKASPKETLERLDKDIRHLQAWRNRNADLAKRSVVYLILFTVAVYFAVAILGFFFYRPKEWKQFMFLIAPLFVLPFLVYGVKRSLNYLFVQRLSKCDTQLVELRAERKEVIDRVVNEEPFRVAKELLQRFDPKSPHLEQFGERPAASPAQHQFSNTVRQRRLAPDRQELAAGGRPLEQAAQAQREQQLLAQQQRQEQLLRRQQEIIAQQQRQLQARQQRSDADSESGSAGTPSGAFGPSLPVYELMPGHVAGPAPGPPRPVPILPRERSAFDKIVEFLVGDGPNNRCALICAKCYSHNGMALLSEFEYCTFRCAYCYHLNPARKQQPVIHETETSRENSVQGTGSGNPAHKQQPVIHETETSRENPVQGTGSGDPARKQQPVTHETETSRENPVQGTGSGNPAHEQQPVIHETEASRENPVQGTGSGNPALLETRICSSLENTNGTNNSPVQENSPADVSADASTQSSQRTVEDPSTTTETQD